MWTQWDTQQDGIMVGKCSVHSNTALIWRHNNRDDILTTAGQTANVLEDDRLN